MLPLLQPNPHRAPRKHFRGQRRYYRRLLQRAQTVNVSLGPGDWFDLWHFHADWLGYGNLSWRHRRAHLEANCTFYRTLGELLPAYTEPYHLFLEDSRYDSVYLHTPNPNRTNSPLEILGLTWGIPEVATYLESEFRLPVLRAGRNDKAIYAYSPELGVPLESQRK